MNEGENKGEVQKKSKINNIHREDERKKESENTLIKSRILHE